MTTEAKRSSTYHHPETIGAIRKDGHPAAVIECRRCGRWFALAIMDYRTPITARQASRRLPKDCKGATARAHSG